MAAPTPKLVMRARAPRNRKVPFKGIFDNGDVFCIIKLDEFLLDDDAPQLLLYSYMIIDER